MYVFDPLTRMVAGRLSENRIRRSFYSVAPSRPVESQSLTAHCVRGAALWCPGQFDGFPKLTIKLPPAGELRIRRILSRSAPRPITKYPSVRLGRSVHCESALEVEAAELLDACAGVTSFAEQAAEISYEWGGESHRHVPDFVVEAGGKKAFVEVKYSSTVTAVEQTRTQILKCGLKAMGYDYYLVTEAHLSRGAYLDNARYLLRRGRQPVPERARVRLYCRAQSTGLCLGELSGTDELNHVAAMLLGGALTIPMEGRLHPGTRINVATAEEGALWVWELFN